jgi:hypothetical protein
MHPDEGYGGSKMIPGYAGAYKNSKNRIIGLKANQNPKNFGPSKPRKGKKFVEEMQNRSRPVKRK